MACPHCRPSESVDAFGLIGKERAEFFDDGYFISKKLFLKTKNTSGVEIAAENEIMQKGIFGNIAASYKTSSVSLDRFAVKSDGRISLEAAMALNPFLKLTVAAEDSRQEPGKPLHSYGKVGFEYRNPMVLLASDVDIVNGPVLKSSVVGNYNSLRIGAQAICNTHLEGKLNHSNTANNAAQFPELVDLSFAAAYRGIGWNAAVRTRDFLRSLRVSYIQSISPQLEVGAQVDYGLKYNTQKFNIGVKTLLDDKSSVKCKLDTNALLFTSYEQRMNDHVKLTACAQVDVSDWSADSHKFGFGLHIDG